MKLIPRTLQKELKKLAKAYPVITLLGPRQSGKTTLVKETFPNYPYVSLENLDDRAFAESDPRGFLENYKTGVILDEIQRFPELLSYLQGIVDNQSAKGLFILTGSHQLALHQSISQSLAGRTAILKLLPFSLAELPQPFSQWSQDAYLYQGFYPRIYHDELNPTKFYSNYIQTYIERDVRQMINVKDLSQFQKFLKLCASRVGQLLNMNNLSNELGISNHTVTNWLSILEASFVIVRIQPYFKNFGKRLIKTPKLYFTDVGLAAYLLDIQSETQIARDPLRGALMENLVVLDIIKNILNQGYEPSCYFYRDSNANEVDLLLKKGNILFPIEIKASKTFNREFLKGLQYFQELAGAESGAGFLIYGGSHEQKIDNINVINYKHTAELIEI